MSAENCCYVAYIVTNNVMALKSEKFEKVSIVCILEN